MGAGAVDTCRVVVAHAPSDRRFAMLLQRDLLAAGTECRLVEREEHLAPVLAAATAPGPSLWLIALLSPAALSERTVHAAVEAGLRLAPHGGLHAVVPFVVEPCDSRLLPPGWAHLEGFDGSVRYIEALQGLCSLLGLRSARGQEWIEAEPTTTLAALPKPEQWGAATGSSVRGGPLPHGQSSIAAGKTPYPPQYGQPERAPVPPATSPWRVSRRTVLATGAGLGALAMIGAGAVLAGRFADSTEGQNTSTTGPRLRWTSSLGGSVTASLLAEAGIVYLSSTEGALYAVSALNGARLWNVPRTVPMSAAPALAHGMVYAAWADGLIAAHGTRDGARHWSFHAAGQIDAALAVASGVVYVSCEDRHLYALDARTGNLLWKRPMEYGPLAAPAVTDDTVLVSGAGGVTALDAPTGELLWQYPATLNGPTFTAPAMHGDAVYVGARDSMLYALAAADGASLWSFKALDELRARPTVDGDVVYISSLDTRVYALEASSGKQLWRFLTYGPTDIAPSSGLTSPIVYNDTVYLGTDRARLFALSAADGTQRWSFSASSPVRASPAVTGAMVVFAASDGTLYGLST